MLFGSSFQFLSTSLGHLATDAEIIAAASLVQLRLAVMSGKVLISQSTLTVACPCVFEAASRVAPEIGICLCVQLWHSRRSGRSMAAAKQQKQTASPCAHPPSHAYSLEHLGGAPNSATLLGLLSRRVAASGVPLLLSLLPWWHGLPCYRRLGEQAAH